MTTEVRVARATDASAACAAVRASIVELCEADHQNDHATLAAWLANKTSANFAQWISAPTHCARVALLAGEVAGFGLLNLSGSIALLYIAPTARFRGASTALLLELEAAARAHDLARLTLKSTTTALSFYRSRGYRLIGPTEPGFGITLGHSIARDLKE